MSHEDLARKRRLDEILRQHQQRLAEQANASGSDGKAVEDPEVTLVSDGTKLADAAKAPATNPAKVGLIEMMEKTKLARDRLREASKVLATPRPVKPVPPAPELLPPSEPTPVKMEWPTMRLFGPVELGVVAALAWGFVVVGLLWTHTPTPAAPDPAPAADVSAVQSPAIEPEVEANRGLAPAIKEATVSPPTVASVPVTTTEPANASSAPAPQAMQKPKSAPEVDDQWTEDANEELDEWERVLRSE
jgi:hypothetical protein